MENYYKAKIAMAKVSYHVEMAECNKWAAGNTTDPKLKKRYLARMYAQRKLVRKYRIDVYNFAKASRRLEEEIRHG